jgi:DNA-binding LytR/AlgR family response regulator
MRRLGVLVVEDEQLARERLARLVAEQADFELVAACGNCDEAIRIVASQAVDIALLDIQMPGISGLEFSERLKGAGGESPVVVFVTAHKRFAFDAFKVHAADYLLKPFDRARLKKRRIAHERLSAARRSGWPNAFRLSATPPNRAPPRNRKLRRPAFRRARQRPLLIVRSEQIDWIEVDGRDCVPHCGSKNHVVAGCWPNWPNAQRRPFRPGQPLEPDQHGQRPAGDVQRRSRRGDEERPGSAGQPPLPHAGDGSPCRLTLSVRRWPDEERRFLRG